jgi:hypothetical protein
VKKSSTSRNKRIEAFIKKVAAKKIQKLAMPFIKRVSIDIEDRIKTYKMYQKYLNQYNPKQCLKVVKKGKLVEYSIADDNIKIVKKIGTESVYGAIYLSKGSNVGELFRFASKIMKRNKSNYNEILILTRLSKLVINKLNPHFPIMYHNFECTVPSKNPKLPKFAKNTEYFINLNELANGDLKMFMLKEFNNSKLTNNALAQIYISILSFHSLGYSHNDAHWGNFLYHKITPGGYIRYDINGKELYLENVGYLWVIWDYGFTAQLDKKNIVETMKDYYRILGAFENQIRIDGWVPNNCPITADTKAIASYIKYKLFDLMVKNKVPKVSFDNEIFDILIDNTKLFIKRADLPKSAAIINNSNPYIINNFGIY